MKTTTHCPYCKNSARITLRDFKYWLICTFCGYEGKLAWAGKIYRNKIFAEKRLKNLNEIRKEIENQKI
jgi:ribosomal protein L37AE/L43A